jgi:phenylacetate-CoA ligase
MTYEIGDIMDIAASAVPPPATGPAAPPASDQLQRLGSLTGRLLARDRWSRDQLMTHQSERLRALLRHSVAHSPYYRDTLGPNAAERPLDQLPTLSKAALMEHFDQVVCDPRLRRGDLEAHLRGSDAAQPFRGTYRVLTTSGTTGLRGIFALSAEEAEAWIAVSMRDGTRAGMAPHMRMVGIGPPGAVHVTRQLYGSLERGPSDVPSLSVLTPVPEMVAALNAYRPDVLLGYPTVAGMLAEEQLAGRLRIQPKAGLYGGEPLTRGLRDRIHAAWGFEPRSTYAATEAPTIAVGTLDTGLEIAEDVLIVEVVDAHNVPVPVGVPGAKVLITNLINYAQPLIRYELSDSVTLAAGANPNGRPYRRIASVDGRSADVLQLRARDGRDVALHPTGFGKAFAQLPEIREYQLVHDEHGLHVRIVMAADARVATVDRLRRSLADAITAAGAVVPPITIDQVEALQREPGIGAKFRLVTSTVPRGGPTPTD